MIFLICRKLLDISLQKMEGLKVEDLRVGLGYTAVRNSSGGVGLAYVLRDRLTYGCSQLEGAGEYIGKDLAEIARMFMDHNNPLKASLGLAAINSVSPREDNGYSSGDILDVLEIKKGDWVGMIGNFAPLVHKIRSQTPHLFVIEDKPEYQKNGQFRIFDEIISNCDIMIITATTLINKTFEHVISKAKKARKKALLGPSAPLFKEFYQDFDINVVSGMIVEDSDKVINIVSQGGGTRFFKNYSRKVNLVIK